MRCPRCGSDQLAVLDSRGEDAVIRRRRECESCRFRFTTYERIELSLPMVVKKDGRREPYHREKLKGGLLRAVEKTPVSVEEVDRAVESIESKIHEMNLREIPSRQIGELVMEKLHSVNKVAYVRFASVVDTLQSLGETDKKRGKTRT